MWAAMGRAPSGEPLPAEAHGILNGSRRSRLNEPPRHLLTPTEAAHASMNRHLTGQAVPARRRVPGSYNPFAESAEAQAPEADGARARLLSSAKKRPSGAPPSVFGSAAVRSLLAPGGEGAAEAGGSAPGTPGGERAPLLSVGRGSTMFNEASAARLVASNLSEGFAGALAGTSDMLPPAPTAAESRAALLARRTALRESAGEAGARAALAARGLLPGEPGAPRGGRRLHPQPRSGPLSNEESSPPSAAAEVPRVHPSQTGGRDPGIYYARELAGSGGPGVQREAGAAPPARDSAHFTSTARAAFAGGEPGARNMAHAPHPGDRVGQVSRRSAVAVVRSPAKDSRIGGSLAGFLLGGE